LKNKFISKHTVYFAAGLILFLISLLYSNANDSRKGETTVFLNSSDLLMDFTIEIYNQDNMLELSKTGNVWFATLYESTTKDMIYSTIADSQRCNSLVEKLISNHKLYKISDNKSKFQDLNLADSSKESYVIAVYRSSDSTLYCGLQFGKESPSTGTICLRNHMNDENVVYETKNVFSNYLSVDLNLWADGEIFAEARSRSSTAVQSPLLKYRHGNVSSKQIDPSQDCARIVSVTSPENRTVIAYFYKDGDDYLLRKKIVPSDNDGEKLKMMFRQEEETVYEVSSWTFGSIIASQNSSRL